jgi:hypothetical protein
MSTEWATIRSLVSTNTKFGKERHEMTTEIYSAEVNSQKQQVAKSVSVGILLIGLGILLFTGWWWPGIMFAIGVSSGAKLVLEGKIVKGIGTLALFCAIPAAVWVFNETAISWSLVGPVVLIGVGVTALVKAFFLRKEKE